MLRFFALAALAAAGARAQQPDMIHLALTGRVGEVSIDFASHRENCTGECRAVWRCEGRGMLMPHP